MNKILGLLLVGLLLTISGSNVRAGPLEDAVRNNATKIRSYRPLAEKGDAKAQSMLSKLYGEKLQLDIRAIVISRPKNDYREMRLLTKGYNDDRNEYLKWIEKAADNGDAVAQFELGEIFRQGSMDVPQNYAAALRLLTKAAEQGHHNAQYTLGFMFHKGQGVQKDAQEAVKWYQLSGSPIPVELRTAKEDGQSSLAISIPMQQVGGIYVVPVLINDTFTLDFVVDSGAADVSIPADVVMTLMRMGTIRESDFLGQKTYVLADGSKVPSQTFRIRSLKVGNKVLENVNGSVASVQGSLLLGQSFLSHFKSWSVDNTTHALLLSD